MSHIGANIIVLPSHKGQFHGNGGSAWASIIWYITFACIWVITWVTFSPKMDHKFSVCLVQSSNSLPAWTDWSRSEIFRGVHLWSALHVNDTHIYILNNTMWCTFSLFADSLWLHNRQNSERLFYQYTKDMNFHQKNSNKCTGFYFFVHINTIQLTRIIYPPTLLSQSCWYHYLPLNACTTIFAIIFKCKNDLICIMMSCLDFWVSSELRILN